MHVGHQITDAVAGWVQAGFAAGPFDKSEIPVDVKINGILTRPKPNGSVRVILNLSAPEGSSVNDGIDVSSFPATMSSTAKWLQCLNAAGTGALMTKLDWSDAYKHQHVRKEDLNLQWFQCMGKYFCEPCLVFGASSSAGIYDQSAKLVLDLVICYSGFPRNMVCQYLDDVCACSNANSDSLSRFRNAYIDIANQLGVKLAPT